MDSMRNENEPSSGKNKLSLRDHFLLVIMGFSALLTFALSFTLWEPDGRPHLFIACVVVYLISVWFARERKALVLSTLAFLALRLIWGAVTAGVHSISP